VESEYVEIEDEDKAGGKRTVEKSVETDAAIVNTYRVALDGVVLVSRTESNDPATVTLDGEVLEGGEESQDLTPTTEDR
jgi:hypothetical protein